MDNNKKQAYLIMAHKCDETFITLLRLLDDERNDLFIHMDKKNREFAPDDISLEKSGVYYTEKRANVQWGGYSLIEAELLLLEKAISVGAYEHYHLLSGEDLPIKSQDEIHRFFECNGNREFIGFDSQEFEAYDRVRYYYFFQEKIGRGNHFALRALNKVSLMLQKALKIQRNYDQSFQKGTQWFSISDDFARYVVSKRDWIRKTFRYTWCCDEVFLQTLCINSEYKKRIYYNAFDNDYRAIMRLIDWERGEPYVFRESDIEELLSSDKLFARKFQADVDVEIIREIGRRILD